MNEEDEFYQYAAFHTISDFADLSIAEIIALEFLVRYAEPVVRHTLYTEVKQFLEYKEKNPFEKEKRINSEIAKKFYDFINTKKHFSTSSFYNSLSNLAEKGLLKINQNKKGKKSFIEPTPYTQYVPKLLLKFLINNNIMDSAEYREDFSKDFLEKIGNRKFERILSIWFSEYEVLSIVKQLIKYADEVCIVSKNDQNGKNKAKINKIRYISMYNQQISIPENTFDGVIVPVYKPNPKFYNMTRNEILTEIVRVCKPKGLIILVAVANIPLSNNFFMNELIKLYNLALNNRIFTENQLKLDMSGVGLINVKIYQHQGLLIGIGQNP
ncbi:MAG: hypothetical protein ACTSQJ_02630 [Promethearchaeota archaeon]